MLEKFRKNIATIIFRNSMNLPLGKRFLRNGNERMFAGWNDVAMTDQDLYSGYGYAVIKKRANKVVEIAVDKVRTDSADDNKKIDHPYLTLIKESKNFSEHEFWRNISTYLDLEGVFFLMALRNKGETAGPVQEFKLLNPYNITRVFDRDGNLGGYTETKNGMQRVLSPSMIIPIKELNPFDENANFAMTDAAKEFQFTLKTSGDYTRHALKGAINAPGIVSTDVVLDDEKFKNFISRVSGHEKGEPIYGNGAGSIKWESMNPELSKAALKDTNEISREGLFAAAGVSKTFMGIEQSGTTRETARVQKDLFTESEALPRIDLVLDALNQDYKTNYPDEYAKSKVKMVVDNPVESDHDSDKTEVEVKQAILDLYQSLIDKGYTEELAAQYANGEIGLEKLGKPTNEPKPDPKLAPPPEKPTPPPADDTKGKKNEVVFDVEDAVRKIEEAIEGKIKIFEAHLTKNRMEDQGKVIKTQEATLQNAVINVEGQLVVAAVNRIPKLIKNDIESESDLLTKTDKKKAESELTEVLVGFYLVMFALTGPERMNQRISELGLKGEFVMSRSIKAEIEELSEKIAHSHVDTIASDIYKTARAEALKGKSQQEIISTLTTQYSTEMTKNRSKVIAKTETNRAFTLAQFEADKQFAEENDIVDRVFKKWRTNSANPCAFCESLAAEPAILLSENFRSMGDTIEAGGKSYKVDFTSLEAGNAHPNCSCDYEMIIESEKVKK